MRRRFGRRRRGADEAKRLDVSRELNRVIERGAAPVTEIAPVAADEVPPSVAAVGIGNEPEGGRCVVAVSPDSGSAAWLGGVSVALRLAEEESFTGRVWVLSPIWRAPGRVLLQALPEVPFEVRALAPLAEGAEGAGLRIDAETGPSVALSVALSTPLAESESPRNGLRARASDALRGLAAKHGGVLQRESGTLRLVLMGQAVASLSDAELEILRPRRDRVRLSDETLSDVFDQLEGSIRKVMSDRKNRDGEPGLRARAVSAFCDSLGLRKPVLWPIAWGEECPLDALGTTEDGRAVGVAIRDELGLAALLPLAEAAALLAPVASWMLPGARPGAGLPVRLAVAAGDIELGAQRVLHAFAPRGDVFELNAARGAIEFRRRDPRPSTGPGVAAQPARETPSGLSESAAAVPVAAAPSRQESAVDAEGAKRDLPDKKPARRFEEMSLFDLSEDEEGQGDGGPRRRRRRGGRGRSRNGGEARSRGDEGSESSGRTERNADSPEPAPEASGEGGRPRRRRRRRRRSRPLMVEDVAEEEVDEEEEAATGTGPADESIDGIDETDDDEESEDGESGDDEDVDALQEDAAALDTPPAVAVDPKPARPVRRRAAIVAHADPVSIGAGVLLARDLRLVDGIWVYQQPDLMTFFRSVATDLREGTSIYLIGFTASPARETLQTASLYRDRLVWFDHHDWPPEDIEAMRQAIGTEGVHIVPGAGSSLPLVAAQCSRRSRFSDKFLDLLTGRFSPHDYERWGRLWWWRLGEIAKKTGERRRDLDPLLSGRPSDLAREAAKHELPPLPAEAEYVASRDVPLVHFGGYTLLRLSVPAALDLTLTARIARERYRAQLVVAAHEGDRAVVLMGDDSNNRRSFDLSAMAEHLAAKFSWVEVLPGADHVTRIRVADLLQRPERLDEIVAEMAMGRSVLEG